MNSKIPKTLAQSCAALILALTALSQPAIADDDSDDPKKLVIQQVQIWDDGTALIRGHNFPDSEKVNVSLADGNGKQVRLEFVEGSTPSETELEVRLPGAPSEGGHLVTVYKNKKGPLCDKAPSKDCDEFDLTVSRELVDRICSAEPRPETCLYAIGDEGPGGGLVFHIDNPDGNGRGIRGLEAAPMDQSALVTWGCEGTPIAGASGKAIGTGEQNTAGILEGCAESDIAAQVADVYELNGFGDWFLPSKEELSKMYTELHLKGMGGFSDFRFGYWSSSEGSDDDAWSQEFHGGNQRADRKSDDRRVRAVRAF